MTLFISLLPLYLMGNLHCAGMCGPLVMMLGRHQFRHFYFLGRCLSYSFAGMLAGELGTILNIICKNYSFSAWISIMFGISFLFMGWYISLRNRSLLSFKKLKRLNFYFSLLILKDKPLTTFLFGFFTVILPCGQTLVVFSACALHGNAWAGLANGFFFAVFTSPSLFFAMKTHAFLRPLAKYYNPILGSCSLLIGGIAILRGLAELEWIEHLVINPQSANCYHIIIY